MHSEHGLKWHKSVVFFFFFFLVKEKLDGPTIDHFLIQFDNDNGDDNLLAKNLLAQMRNWLKTLCHTMEIINIA